MGASDLERARPGRGTPPPDGARTRRGHLRLDKLDPLLLGGQAHDPLALALSLSSARSHPVLHKSARPAAPLYVPPPKGAPRGRGLKPCVAFYFFFFCIWKREQCSILPYLCFYSGTNVGCVRVCFLVLVFLKKWEEEKNSPFLALFPLPFVLPTPLLPPLFFSVLFCYESTFLFVILGSPGFLFSVKSPYASSALRLLFPQSGPYGLGGAWPAPLLSRLFPPSYAPPQRRGSGSGRWVRSAPPTSGERHLGAPGRWAC